MSRPTSGLSSELARLEDAYQSLMVRWDAVREQWRDANAEAIEEQFLAPLSQLVRNAEPAIGQLGDEMARAVRTCGEPREML